MAHNVLQALGGAGALPSLPQKDSAVVTGSAENFSAAPSVENVSDVPSRKKSPPAVATKPKPPSQRISTSQ